MGCERPESIEDGPYGQEEQQQHDVTSRQRFREIMPVEIRLIIVQRREGNLCGGCMVVRVWVRVARVRMGVRRCGQVLVGMRFPAAFVGMPEGPKAGEYNCREEYKRQECAAGFLPGVCPLCPWSVGVNATHTVRQRRKARNPCTHISYLRPSVN